MKNFRMLLACACVAVSLFSVATQAQAAEELPNLATEEAEAEKSLVSGSVEVIGSRDTGVWVYAERKVTDKWAFFINAVKYQRGFQQVTFGPAYYLTPEIQVGVSLGAARNTSSEDSRLFISAFGYLETDSLKAEIILERFAHDSRGISYYRVYAETPVTPISEKLAIGVHGEKDVGWGPRLSWSIRENINIWLSPLVERQSGNVLVGGIQFTF